MQLTGVHHVSINVRDAAEARAFYVVVVGLTERSDRPDFPFAGHWFDVGSGGQQLHTLEVDGVDAPDGQHFAIAVADLDTAIAHLAQHDVATSGPMTIDGICRQTFFRDPTGNLIELNQKI